MIDKREGEYESKVQQKLPVPTEYLSPQLRCCHWAAFLLVTQDLALGAASPGFSFIVC